MHEAARDDLTTAYMALQRLLDHLRRGELIATDPATSSEIERALETLRPLFTEHRHNS